MGNKVPSAPVTLAVMVFKLPSAGTGEDSGAAGSDTLILEHDTASGKRKVTINGAVQFEQQVSSPLLPIGTYIAVYI